ncbi:hypothetical protein JKF63_05421 [Porcisia hertigi]|uniref:Uncharacterized protein n=1 Tax=Porcisia hertigi TaxID=2761500 RepID=A0A836HYQ0_9TRYP|nr:hypothetical protein JKF63_05421 [Porcisia hertigi]
MAVAFFLHFPLCSITGTEAQVHDDRSKGCGCSQGNLALVRVRRAFQCHTWQEVCRVFPALSSSYPLLVSAPPTPHSSFSARFRFEFSGNPNSAPFRFYRFLFPCTQSYTNPSLQRSVPLKMSPNGKYALSVVAAVAVFAATFALAMSVTERMPEGTYCGNYASGLVVGNVTVKSGAELFDFNVKGLGMNLECNNEKFLYDPKTHHAVVVGATDPNDCIGSVLTENHLTMEITYAPGTDEIFLDFGIVKITCKKCALPSYV